MNSSLQQVLLSFGAAASGGGGGGGGSVAFDSALDLVHSGNTSPQTFSLTTAGTNRVMYLFVTNNGGFPLAAAPTYNGVSSTLLDSDADIAAAGGGYIAVYRLINPTVGSNTVSFDISGQPPTDWTFSAISLNGVHQTTPNGTVVKEESQNTVAAVTISSSSTSIVLAVVTAFIGAATTFTITGTDQTSRTKEMTVDGMGFEVTTTPGGAVVIPSWLFNDNLFHIAYGYSIDAA